MLGKCIGLLVLYRDMVEWLLLGRNTQLVTKFSEVGWAVDWKTPHIPDTMGRMDMETSHVMDSLRSVAMFQTGLNVKG